MATHSSILAGKIPWTEEPGGLCVHGVAKSQSLLSTPSFSETHLCNRCSPFLQLGVQLPGRILPQKDTAMAILMQELKLPPGHYFYMSHL